MKHKASLVLMEQLVMILVFALAAAVCLRAFVLADSLSRETAVRDQAAIACQNMAETIKSCGSLAPAAEALGAERTNGGWLLPGDGFDLILREKNSLQPGLGMASVQAVDGERELFTLTVGWQEVLP